jgi:hypothetical protein
MENFLGKLVVTTQSEHIDDGAIFTTVNDDLRSIWQCPFFPISGQLKTDGPRSHEYELRKNGSEIQVKNANLDLSMDNGGAGRHRNM